MMPLVIGNRLVRFSTATSGSPCVFSPCTCASGGVATLLILRDPLRDRSHSGLRRAPGLSLLPDPLLVLDREVTRVGMAAPTIEQLRDVLVARLEAVRTTGMERTSRRHEDERGRRALDRNEPLPAHVDVRDRLEQAPRVGMEWLCE